MTEHRILAMVDSACHILQSGSPAVSSDRLHRFDKADTAMGLDSLQSVAELGVPYSMVLYERFLGRPFAGHRDSISELVGNVVENAIEDVLSRSSISFRKTKPSGTAAGVRSSSGLHHSQRVQPPDRDRGKTHRRRRNGTRQGDTGTASRIAQYGGATPGASEIRGDCLHRRSRFRRPPRGYAKVIACNERQGFHTSKYGPACATYASRRVPFSVDSSRSGGN